MEADHGGLQRLIKPTRGFGSMKTAYATLQGVETLRMIRKRQCRWLEPGSAGEVRFVNQRFRIYA